MIVGSAVNANTKPFWSTRPSASWRERSPKTNCDPALVNSSRRLTSAGDGVEERVARPDASHFELQDEERPAAAGGRGPTDRAEVDGAQVGGACGRDEQEAHHTGGRLDAVVDHALERVGEHGQQESGGGTRQTQGAVVEHRGADWVVSGAADATPSYATTSCTSGPAAGGASPMTKAEAASARASSRRAWRPTHSSATDCPSATSAPTVTSSRIPAP